jgi:tetratricopeptide (TPR) repeat protein
MPDLTKHLTRAKQLFDKGACDDALTILGECIEVDPANVEIFKLLIPISRRKAKEAGGKTSLFSSLKMPVMSSDPLKQFAAAAKQLGKMGDPKSLAGAMEAAVKLSATVKPVADVAVFLGEEFRNTGMFNDKVLWQLAHMYYERFNASGKKDEMALEKAIATLTSLEKAVPNHPEAGRTVKNWHAMQSMMRRNAGSGQSADYRNQVASTDAARRQEVLNRNVRTLEDAREVIKYLDEDLQKAPGDKFLWVKKGDVHRRISELPAARTCYEKAQALDQHDFTITMKLGDLRIDEAKERLKALPAGGPEAAAARKQLLDLEIAEYRARVERQPTDMGHRFNLARNLLTAADIDGAAAEFQKTVNDPRLRKSSHRGLAICFQKRNLLDLAIQQYKLFLPLVEDEQSDEAKEGRFQLARLYEDRGQTAEAIVEFEKLVTLDFGYKDAADRLSKLRG